MNEEQTDTITFAEHKERTAKDCEAIADTMTKLAASCREGHMALFEAMWHSEGTLEGDAKIMQLREIILLRYSYRLEHLKD